MRGKMDTDRLYLVSIRVQDLKRSYKTPVLNAHMHTLAVAFGYKNAEAMRCTLTTAAKARSMSKATFEAAAMAQRCRLTGEQPLPVELWQTSPVTAEMLRARPWTTAALSA